MDQESESPEDKSVAASRQGKKVMSSKSVGDDKSSPTARLVRSNYIFILVTQYSLSLLVVLIVTMGLSRISPLMTAKQGPLKMSPPK
jgi:hypothetical protein